MAVMYERMKNETRHGKRTEYAQRIPLTFHFHPLKAQLIASTP